MSSKCLIHSEVEVLEDGWIVGISHLSVDSPTGQVSNRHAGRRWGLDTGSRLLGCDLEGCIPLLAPLSSLCFLVALT